MQRSVLRANELATSLFDQQINTVAVVQEQKPLSSTSKDFAGCDGVVCR